MRYFKFRNVNGALVPFSRDPVQVFQITGKYLSEALILASTNPQYDNRLFTKLRIQYKKIARSQHIVYTHSEQFMYTTCSELGIFMY